MSTEPKDDGLVVGEINGELAIHNPKNGRTYRAPHRGPEAEALLRDLVAREQV